MEQSYSRRVEPESSWHTHTGPPVPSPAHPWTRTAFCSSRLVAAIALALPSGRIPAREPFTRVRILKLHERVARLGVVRERTIRFALRFIRLTDLPLCVVYSIAHGLLPLP